MRFENFKQLIKYHGMKPQLPQELLTGKIKQVSYNAGGTEIDFAISNFLFHCIF